MNGGTALPKTVGLPSGERVPALGMGTWYLGERPALRAEELATLQEGIDRGLGLIDTAEMYGEGAAERLVGEAIRGRRDRVFLVSKVYPHHASRKGAVAACERSLERLGVDCLDLYLLHWRGGHPLAETLAAFEALRRDGKIRHWGVSNFDPADMAELYALPDGPGAATDQVLYNLARRGVEWDLRPWCVARRIPLMAYSPLEQGRLLNHPGLRGLASRLGASPGQVALAWLLQQDQVLVIPKAATRAHLAENLGALDLRLDSGSLAELDRLFPPPSRPELLAML